MKDSKGQGILITTGFTRLPKSRLNKRAMAVRAYSQRPALNRKERRAAAKARKMLGGDA